LYKYDLSQTYKESNFNNGTILICVKKDHVNNLLEDYEHVKKRRNIVFKMDKDDLSVYINQDLNYPAVLKFVHEYFMNDNLEIVKFKGTIGSNDIEEIRIQHNPSLNFVKIGIGIGVQDLNKLGHIHKLFVESKVVRGLFRKLGSLKCLVEHFHANKNVSDIDKEDFEKTKIETEVTYNKKVYEYLKEECKLLEVFENSPVIYEYETIDEYKGEGLLVIKEKSEEKEIRMVKSNGTVFVGYPLLLPLCGSKTVRDFRLNYGILSKLTKYSALEEHVLGDDDIIDNLDSMDIIVNYEG